jgi:hypothetical protein
MYKENFHTKHVSLQETSLLFIKCFHWILNEFIGSTTHDLMKIQWIH